MYTYMISYEVQYKKGEKEKTKKFSQLFKFDSKLTSAMMLQLLDKLRNQFTDLPKPLVIVPIMIFYFDEVTE